MSTPAYERDTINADLEAMMRAATVDFPDKATSLHAVTAELSGLTEVLNAQAALCSDPPSMVDLLGVHDLLHQAIRRCVLTMNDCSQALVRTVDRFAESDARAADELSTLRRDVPGLGIGQPAPQAPEPDRMPGSAEAGAPDVEPR